MFYSYPTSLINETISCFKDENNISLSQEEAVEYLDSLSGLFLSFVEESQSSDDSQTNTQIGGEVGGVSADALALKHGADANEPLTPIRSITKHVRKIAL